MQELPHPSLKLVDFIHHFANLLKLQFVSILKHGFEVISIPMSKTLTLPDFRDISIYQTTSHAIWSFISHLGDYIPRSEAEWDI